MKHTGYTIKTFLTDREFECIRESLPEGANLNTTVINEHVSNIECKNRVIKERTIGMIITSVFKNIPDQIIIEIIRFVGIWINQEPIDNGVLNVYSTRNIIIGPRYCL